MRYDFGDQIIKDIVASILAGLLGCSFGGRMTPCYEDTQAACREVYMARNWVLLPKTTEELKPFTNNHVNEPPWSSILHIQSHLHMTAAPANIWTATTWEIWANATQLSCSWTSDCIKFVDFVTRTSASIFTESCKPLCSPHVLKASYLCQCPKSHCLTLPPVAGCLFPHLHSII